MVINEQTNIRIIRGEVLQSLEDALPKIIEQFYANNLNASFESVNSLKIVGSDNGAKLLGKKGIRYAWTGRGSGGVPGDIYQRLEDWVRNKSEILIQPIPYVRTPSDRWQPKYTPEQRGLNKFIYGVIYNLIHRGSYRRRNNKPVNEIDIIIEETKKQALKNLNNALFNIIVEINNYANSNRK